MMNAQKLMVQLAACALLAGGTIAQAETKSQPLTSEMTLQPKYMAEAAPTAPSRKPLMGALNEVGLAKPLEDLGINIYGFIEGSYTYNFSASGGGMNEGRVFDVYKNQGQLNQLDLTVERAVDLKKFDIGGKVEMLYGTDASFIHSNGLFDWYDSASEPANQIDLVQAYVNIAIPVGNGIDLKLGKFTTTMGQETINPTTNALYSHSYLFGYAIPFTHTGALASYTIDDNWSIYGGITRGWNQSIEDNNNDAIDGLFGGKYTTDDKKGAVILNISVGPQLTDDTSHYRTVVDVIFSYAISDTVTGALNADYGVDTDGANGTAEWYGVAGYLGYSLCEAATINGRAEWYHDVDGFTIGTTGDLYEITLGVALKPAANDALLSNFVIRPEIRYDFSSQDFFNGGADQDQLTFGVDAIFTF